MSRRRLQVAVGAAFVPILLGAQAPAAHADPSGDQPPLPCGVCHVGKGKAFVGMSRSQTAALPKDGKAHVKKKDKTVVKVVPYEYQIPPSCPGNTPGDDRQVSCERSVKACVPVKNAVGPLVLVWRRLVLPNNEFGDWERIGETCWPNLVPNAKHKPGLTVAMIKAAFSNTPFVKPRVTMQPVGNRTLVNLPTYFAVDFSGPGYGPDEIRTVTLLGHQVRIKPVLKSNTFRFGDGTSLGPTTSRGGVYPDGDVKHTYTKRGTVGASITTVYGGQFAVDGGDFTDLPGTATVTGPVQQLQVLEATGHLVR